MYELKAFIVEDSPVIQENLSAALEEMVPLKVMGCAEDEAGAVAWLSKPSNRCDVAVLDLFLRQGSGLGVLRWLMQTGTNCERVVLTNYANPDLRKHCLALGASRVFDKSGEIDALIEYCQSLAAARDAANVAA